MPATRFDRIRVGPEVMESRRCGHGLRFPVFRLLSTFAAGDGTDAALPEDPCLRPEDIQAALACAASPDEDPPAGFGR